jgi:predicted transposase/invertase (TIGR01784 family)
VQEIVPLFFGCQTDDCAQILQKVAQEVAKISDPRMQNNVVASTSILAGLVLEKDLIQRILRRELMQESVIYQDILLEGKAEGKAEALEQVAANLLNEGMTIDVVVKVTGLSIEQVLQLQAKSA